MLARFLAAVASVVLIAGAAPHGVRAPATMPQTTTPTQTPAPTATPQGQRLTPAQIIATLKRPEISAELRRSTRPRQQQQESERASVFSSEA